MALNMHIYSSLSGWRGSRCYRPAQPWKHMLHECHSAVPQVSALRTRYVGGEPSLWHDSVALPL